MLVRDQIVPGDTIKVLVVEDEADVAGVLCKFIDRSGMRCRCVHTGAAAVQACRDMRPDVVLVDMNLPDMHGVDLIPWLARDAECGIIVVSGSSEEAERVVGIELGADDYVVKPPSLRELVARIRAVHRRVAIRRADAALPDIPTASIRMIGSTQVDLRGKRVTDSSGAPVPLTSAEFKALELLLDSNGEPVSRDRICEAALRRPLGAEDRSVDQLILNLRRKLATECDGRQLISSVRGAGYALRT